MPEPTETPPVETPPVETPPEPIKNPEAVLAKNVELLGKNKAYKAENDAFKALGLTVEEIKALKEDKEKKERAALEAQGNYDKLRQQDEDRHKTELDKERDEKAQLQNHLKDTVAEREIISACLDNDADPNLLPVFVKPFVDITQEDDGTIKIVVIDADGNPRFKEGKPYTVSDLVAEYAEDDKYKRLFAGNKATGMGSTTAANTTTSETVDNPWVTNNYTEMNRIHTDNPDLAAKLKKEAEEKRKATSTGMFVVKPQKKAGLMAK